MSHLRLFTMRQYSIDLDAENLSLVTRGRPVPLGRAIWIVLHRHTLRRGYDQLPSREAIVALSAEVLVHDPPLQHGEEACDR